MINEMTQAASSKLYAPPELAARLGVTVNNLAQMRFRGTGPRYVKVGAKTIRYRESDVEEWLESRTRIETAGR